MARWLVWLLAGVAAVAIGIGARMWLTPAEPEPGSAVGRGVAAIGGPFRLVDQKGQVRTDEDFRGQFMLVYFGYTYCPDVCPTAIQVMSVALDQLGDAGRDVIPILVTIDPERDTVEKLAAYAQNFHPRLVAFTGDVEAVRAAARAYRVYYAKAGDGPDYLMDHTSIIYLMGRDGRYLAHFTHTTDPSTMAERIRSFL